MSLNIMKILVGILHVTMGLLCMRAKYQKVSYLNFVIATVYIFAIDFSQL